MPYAKENDIKICLENMWNWKPSESTACSAACSHHDDFKRPLELVPESVFGACLDVGHAEMAGLGTSAEEMIKSLDKRLIALHIHDNNKLNDCHALPFTYDINFDKVIEALAKINYNGDITFESDFFFSKVPNELIPHAVKYMASIGQYFVDKIKARKSK
jgi:sugar phosphate isomerase/epimerase